MVPDTPAGVGGWDEPEFLAAMVDRAGVGIAVYDSDGVVRYANEHCGDLLGGTAADLRGRHVASFNPGLDRDRFDDYWESFAVGETRRVDTHHRTVDGTGVVPVSVAVTRTEVRGRECHVATIEGVADRADREQELRGYRRLVENLPVGVVRTTPGADGEFRLVNDAMVEIFDADSRADFRDVSVSDIYHDPDRRAQFSDRLQAEGLVRNVELRMETFDDEPVWCEVSGVAVETDDGTVFEIALQDITERKDYQRDRQLFRAAVEQAGHSVLITDRDGVIEYVNPAFVDSTGYSATEAVGQEPSILRSGTQPDSFYTDLWETILAGDVWEAELVNRRKSGELYHAKQTIAPITGEDGTITNFVAIQSDITEQKLREKRLSELTRVLRHDLRNTVTALRGYAQLLEDDLDGEARDRLDRIRDQSESLAATTEKMTNVRQLIERDYDGDASCDLATLLDRLGPKWREAYSDAAVSVESDPVAVNVDAVTVRTVLDELVDNAVVHNDRPVATVTVTAAGPDGHGDHVTVDVADDGPGIPTQERAAVEVGTEDPLAHSSGIGLSHVHWAVTECGGAVEIAENDPRGSVVTLSLPAAESA